MSRPFANFPQEPPYGGSFVDFNSDEDLTEFVATAIASGTNVVLDTYANGVASLSGAATTDDSGAEIQRDGAHVALGLGARVRFLARIQVSETTSANVAAQSDLLCGLAVLDTSLIASAPSAGIYFRKDDGDALLDLVVRASSADVLAQTGAYTLVAGTWYRLAIEIAMDSTTATKGTITFYVDGSSVGSATVTGLPASSAILTESLAFQSGDNTGTKFCLVDYIGTEYTR